MCTYIWDAAWVKSIVGFTWVFQSLDFSTYYSYKSGSLTKCFAFAFKGVFPTQPPQPHWLPDPLLRESVVQGRAALCPLQGLANGDSREWHHPLPFSIQSSLFVLQITALYPSDNTAHWGPTAGHSFLNFWNGTQEIFLSLGMYLFCPVAKCVRDGALTEYLHLPVNHLLQRICTFSMLYSAVDACCTHLRCWQSGRYCQTF